jgi:transcriptional regulator with XRE-family HTH domain
MIVTKRKSIRYIDHAATAKIAKAKLQASKYSLRDVAKIMGVSAAYLSDLTNGKRNWNYEKEHAFLAALKAIGPPQGKE